MPVRREFPPRSLNAEALNEGRVDPQYTRVLIRLLAAHAMAEKLTALGYQRALAALDNPDLRPIVEKNFQEEKNTRGSSTTRSRNSASANRLPTAR